MQVLATKLVAPRPTLATVRRPRLCQLLSRSAARPLTLVSAPAGWGKTSLLSEWIDSGASPGRVVWLGLEAADGDRRSFWEAVAAALRVARPDLAPLPPPQRSGLDAFITSLMNALDARPDPLVLVLDDLQDAASPEVVGDLDRLAEHASPSLRLVLSTRVDPPLRLERLRLAGRVAEVRAADLALTTDEAGSLCEDAGVQLNDRELDLLVERTGGWPTGVRLAVLSLEGRQNPGAFVESFAGDDLGVSSYMVSEVLSHQPPETLDFLLRTCQVDRVSGGLADELTGGSAGRATLAELAARHGLVTALDTRGEWYQYPPLLREVLRLESARRVPDALPQIHRRAARWFADCGEALDAIRHAVAGEAWDLVADMVGQHWLPLLARGKGSSLRDYVDRIPRHVVGADAELALAAAGLLFEAGDEGAADELMASAYELASSLPQARRMRFAATATATSLYRARLRGDVDAALKAARVTLEQPWAEVVGAEVRALTLTSLGMAEFIADDVEAAGEHLRQAAGLATECGNEYVRLVAEAGGAAVELRGGRMESAEARATMAVELAERRGWTTTTAAAQAYLTLAAGRVCAGDLADAEAFVARASTAAARSPDRLLRAWVALMRARVLMLASRPLEVLDALGAIRSLLDSPPSHVAIPAILWEADAWLALGEPERSRAALDVSTADRVPDVSLARARLELAEGEPAAALRDVSAFRGAERAPFMPYAPCQSFAIEALAQDALRDEAAALVALERCLDLAEPRGQGGVLLSFGASMRSLLRRAIARGTSHRSLADELLAALERESGSLAGPLQPLLDPLSERELAVLRFLPTMLSNAEIAAEMFVSPNTVKTHLKHVYRKLDVADRRQAVRRGRELHLLSPGLRAT
jgi:LuxR family transcriptional regulator, maltose regulon positive regulatory protein